MHIYIEIVEKLHLFTTEKEYNTTLNSSIFFVTEDEEIKSCIKGVETTNTGGTAIALASSACNSVPESGTFHVQESLQNTFHDGILQRISNAHTACCWVGS